MKTLLLALPLLSLPACSSLSLKGESVRITHHDSDVAACRFVGEVSAYPPFVGPKDAEHTLRNKAAELGADVVRTHNGVGKATGEAYDCGGKFVRSANH